MGPINKSNNVSNANRLDWVL